MASFKPFEQRARIVQSYPHAGMSFQVLHEWQVGALVRLLEYAVEIAYWLVRVNQENEMELGQGGNLPEQSTLS